MGNRMHELSVLLEKRNYFSINQNNYSLLLENRFILIILGSNLAWKIS